MIQDVESLFLELAQKLPGASQGGIQGLPLPMVHTLRSFDEVLGLQETEVSSFVLLLFCVITLTTNSPRQ